jgi:poly(hydroxyalkanoate) granule-associated protein
MVTKTNKSSNSSAPKSGPDLSSTLKDSAQQIWQAGLGSLSKAQEEGGKVLGSLMKEGLSMQRKTQAAAEEKITESTHKMAGMASDIASKASGQWGKLEGIFEDRVAKALTKLGVPTGKDMAALIARMDGLGKAAGKGAGKAPAKAKAAAKSPAKSGAKTAAKSAAKSAAKTAAKPAAKKAAKRKSA